MNVATHLARAGRIWRERPAIALGAAAWASYGQLAETAARLAGALRARCRPGQRVALAMRNGPAYLEVLYGAWHAALGVVPINVRLHRDEFAHYLWRRPDVCRRYTACLCVAGAAPGADLWSGRIAHDHHGATQD